jgi:hypothetical protein
MDLNDPHTQNVLCLVVVIVFLLLNSIIAFFTQIQRFILWYILPGKTYEFNWSNYGNKGINAFEVWLIENLGTKTEQWDMRIKQIYEGYTNIREIKVFVRIRLKHVEKMVWYLLSR